MKCSCLFLRVVVAGALLLATGQAGLAHEVDYEFAGHEGFGSGGGTILSGVLTLDLNSNCESTAAPGGEAGTSSIYTSSYNTISGSYGIWTFSGIASIYVNDRPEYWSSGQENLAPDSWIVRAALSGPTVNDWTPSYISLFYYVSPSGMESAQIQAPSDPLTSANQYDFQFAIEFDVLNSEPQTLFGTLMSVQSVPEPGAASLILMGAIAIAADRRRFGRVGGRL